MNEVWVIAEQRLGRLMDVSLELLGKGSELAQKLNTQLSAIVLGDNIQRLAGELISYGADRVYLGDDSKLRFYQCEHYARLISSLIEEQDPQIILIGATNIGQDIASRLAARVKTGLIAHCVDLYIREDDKMVAVVPGWGGNLMVRIMCPEKRPQMATVSPGVMSSCARDDCKRGEVIPLFIEAEAELGIEVLEMVEEELQGITLDNADIIIAGGWGLSSVGNFEPVKALAKVLGGAVAGTRPAVDSGWIPETCMIGQSGRTVSPRLFISVGASGAPQFSSGFTKSKVVMAIDQNPDAPIFDVVDIGLVGDLQDILPCLIAELEASNLH